VYAHRFCQLWQDLRSFDTGTVSSEARGAPYINIDKKNLIQIISFVIGIITFPAARQGKWATGREVTIASKESSLGIRATRGDTMREHISWGNFCKWAELILLVLVIGVMAAPAFAQESGTILGTIRDASGGAVPSVRVTITNVDTSDSRTVTTAEDGAFRASGLRPGHYSVKVEKEGFKTITQTDLSLDVAGELVVNSTLEIGSASQQVTVTGEVPVVNTTSSSLGGLVNDQQIAELPLNGRNYTDLTLLQPGITQTTHSGLGDAGIWYSSNGASPRSNNYMIDGALMVTQNGTGPAGMTGNTLGVDGIKEYKVVTSMFGAEYGLLMGSQMVIVSKGGSNNWHGSAFEFLRNNHLDARNFFDPQPSLANKILVDASGNLERLPQFKRNNFGGSFGGPIQKDKTFFWLVYEGLRLSQGDTIQDTTMAAGCHLFNNGGNIVIAGGGTIPAATLAGIKSVYPNATQQILQGPLPGTTTLANPAGTGLATCSGVAAGATIAPVVQPWVGQFPFANESNGASNYTLPGFTHARNDYAQLRVDHNFSNNDTAFARYTFDDARILTPYLGGNLSTADTGTGYPQFSNTGTSRNQYITLGENHIFSAELLNSLRVSWSRTNYVNRFTNNNSPMNPNFLLQDPTTCATSAGGCIWSAVPGLTTAGFTPGSGITAMTPPGTFPNYHIQNVWTIMEDVYYSKGKHAFKFGTMINRFNDPNLQSKSIYGVINFPNLAGFMAGIPSSASVVLPGQSVALNPGVPGATLLAPPFQGNFLDRNVWFNTFGFYAQDDYRATSHLTLNLGLRYEFRTQFTEQYGRFANVQSLATSVNSTLGALMTNPTYKNFSPRLGFAWDVFGGGKTAVRGGFGVYYDVGNYGALLTQNPTGMVPFVANTTVQNTSNAVLTLPLVFSGAGAGRSLQTNDYNAKSPQSLMFNLTISQQLPLGVGLDVSYVGRRGLNLYTGMEGNPVRPLPGTGHNGIPAQYNVTNGQAGCQNQTIPLDANGVPQPFTFNGVQVPSTDPHFPCRINPFFTSAQFFTNAASSWYNALQVNVTKHLGHGLMFQAAYTYSRATDDTQGTRFNDDCGGNSGSAFGQNATQLKLDWGLSCYDVTHAVHFNLLYHLPTFTSRAVEGKLINGWWLSGIVSVQGGSPFRAIVNNDRSFSGIITQSNIMSAALNTTAVSNANGNFIPFNPATVITGDPNHWFNPLMFGEAPLGQLSNQPRNILRNPGLGDFDMSVVKDTKLGVLGEGGNLQFRVEFFNLLNRPNFGFLNTGASVFAGSTTLNTCVNNVQCNVQAPLASAGQITTTNTTSRQIQLAMRVSF
jgi:hypothetical protein